MSDKDYGVEIYDPYAQGSTIEVNTLFHNPDVVEDKLNTQIKENEKERIRRTENKKTVEKELILESPKSRKKGAVKI